MGLWEPVMESAGQAAEPSGHLDGREEIMPDCVELLSDLKLPTLAEVLDPISFARYFRGVSLKFSGGEAIEEIEFRVLRHVAGQRCTLEIRLRTPSGGQVLIGKVFRKDRIRVFDFMTEVHQAGFGLHDEFSIPEPLAYLPSLRLLLQERVEGPVAEEIFWAGDEASQAVAAERSAQWLARFHAQAPRRGEVSPPDEYLNTKRMRECAPRIAKDARFTLKVDRLHDRLEEAAAAIRPLELCAGHGAYRPDHVILCPGRTVVFDLDTHDVADPARDVARFLVALRRLALKLGSIRALDKPYEIFLQTYLAAGQPGVETNLRFFEAAAYLKRAKRILDGRVAHWREGTEAMLDEGLRVLEGATTP